MLLMARSAAYVSEDIATAAGTAEALYHDFESKEAIRLHWSGDITAIWIASAHSGDDKGHNVIANRLHAG